MEAYIPTHWLTANSTTLQVKLNANRDAYNDERLAPYFREQAKLRVEWLEQQIKITKTRELLGGETNGGDY